jgi:hypothetical protein
MGALSGNIFVVGRLTVAAANQKYIPAFLGAIGQFGFQRSQERPVEEEEAEPEWDAPLYVLYLPSNLPNRMNLILIPIQATHCFLVPL